MYYSDSARLKHIIPAKKIPNFNVIDIVDSLTSQYSYEPEPDSTLSVIVDTQELESTIVEQVPMLQELSIGSDIFIHNDDPNPKRQRHE